MFFTEIYLGNSKWFFYGFTLKTIFGTFFFKRVYCPRPTLTQSMWKMTHRLNQCSAMTDLAIVCVFS